MSEENCNYTLELRLSRVNGPLALWKCFVGDVKLQGSCKHRHISLRRVDWQWPVARQPSELRGFQLNHFLYVKVLQHQDQ